MKTLLLGDTHGDAQFVSHAHKLARQEDVKTFIQLGDFDITFDSDLIDSITAWLARDPEHRWYWLDGNHDHHDWLDQTLNRNDHLVRQAPINMGGHVFGYNDRVTFPDRMYYLPRGSVFKVGNTTMLALGGAFSVDGPTGYAGSKSRRKAHVSWFEQEMITASDMYFAMDNAEKFGPIDVMLTHDAPASIKLTTWLKHAGYKKDQNSENNRHNLSLVLEQVKPAELWHGHYHRRYDALYINDDHITTVHGVAANVNERGNIDHTVLPGVNAVIVDF